MDSPTVFAGLRNTLAALYTDESSARRIATDAGLSEARIAFSSRALDNWRAILIEAAKCDHVARLIDVVRNDYPEHQWLHNAWRAYLALLEQGIDPTTDDRPAGADPQRAIRTSGLAPRVPPERFFGRDQVLATLVTRLVAGESLVLWGLPGVGKSALAVTLLDDPQLVAAFPQWRVGLALGPQADPFIILGSALSSFGVEPAAIATVDARVVQLRTILAQRRVLLLLDDVWAVAHVRPLLDACSPTTTLLLTTRQVQLADDLALPNYQLLPLAPNPAHAMLAASGEWAAQAIAADPVTVDSLLTYLGRLPLALHVAGRRLNQMARADSPIQAVAALYQALITKRTSVLHLRVAEQRLGIADAQPELAAVLALSYDALPAAVRRAFARLAVFGPEPQDFDATAMTAVWAADSDQALEWRLALIDAGLLASQPQATGPTRYSLHQILHNFADHCLTAVPAEAHTAALAHADYYATIVAQWNALIAAQQMTYSEPREWEQVATAFNGLTEQVLAPAATAAHTEEGAAVAAVLLTCARHWRNVIYNNHDPRRVRWLTAAALVASQTGDEWDLANVLQAQGDVLAFLKQNDEALAKYEQALRLFQQVGSSLGQANVLQAQGDVLAFLKQNDEALAKYEQALRLFQQVGSSLGQANALLAIGDLRRTEGDYAAAWAAYEGAHIRYTTIGDGYSIARVLYRMGDWQAEQEDPTAAAPLYRQAITLWEAIGLADLAAQIIGPKLARVGAGASNA